MPQCFDKEAIEGLHRGQSLNRNVWAWMSLADWWGILKVCGIKERQGCCQEFSIDKDVCVRVWLWWSEVSHPPPRACNWGFSSITPCPLTPLILSHPVADTFLSQTSARLFFLLCPLRLLINFFMFLSVLLFLLSLYSLFLTHPACHSLRTCPRHLML